MKENFISDLKYFETKNKTKINIISDDNLTIPEYIIDLKNKSKKTIEKIEFLTKLKNLDEIKNEIKEGNIDKKYKKKIFKKKNIQKKNLNKPFSRRRGFSK